MKMLGIVAVGVVRVSQGVPKIFRAPMYRAQGPDSVHSDFGAI